jgi:hypothetical protein
MFGQPKAEQNYTINVAKRLFYKVAHRILRTTVRNQNFIEEEIKIINSEKIQNRNFYLFVCCLKTKILQYNKLLFCL